MPNIIINNYCNQKCSYCFAEDSMTIEKNPTNTQSLAVFLQILKFLKTYNYKDVRLLGGEPLLHKDIRNIFLLSQKWWFDVLLFSNLNLPKKHLKTVFEWLPISMRINCNLNNRDFYTQEEYDRLLQNMKYLHDLWHQIIIGHNVYDISKPYIDILKTAKSVGSKIINLKVTNTIAGKELIVDTGTREYGKYLYSIVRDGKNDFQFEFSCGLDKSIFKESELQLFQDLWIPMRYWCSGASGGYDIDIDWSISKCFPLRSFYLNKNMSIYTFNPEITDINIPSVPAESKGICSAHSTI